MASASRADRFDVWKSPVLQKLPKLANQPYKGHIRASTVTENAYEKNNGSKIEKRTSRDPILPGSGSNRSARNSKTFDTHTGQFRREIKFRAFFCRFRNRFSPNEIRRTLSDFAPLSFNDSEMVPRTPSSIKNVRKTCGLGGDRIPVIYRDSRVVTMATASDPTRLTFIHCGISLRFRICARLRRASDRLGGDRVPVFVFCFAKCIVSKMTRCARNSRRIRKISSRGNF